MKGYERSKLVKLDILINKEEVDALSFIVFEGNAEERGRKMCEKLKKEIPRQQFEIPIHQRKDKECYEIKHEKNNWICRFRGGNFNCGHCNMPYS